MLRETGVGQIETSQISRKLVNLFPVKVGRFLIEKEVAFELLQWFQFEVGPYRGPAVLDERASSPHRVRKLGQVLSELSGVRGHSSKPDSRSQARVA